MHACDVRRVELALFGITSHGVRMTLQEWFLAHGTPALDPLLRGSLRSLPLVHARLRGLSLFPRSDLGAAIRLGVSPAERRGLRHLSPLPSRSPLVRARAWMRGGHRGGAERGAALVARGCHGGSAVLRLDVRALERRLRRHSLAARGLPAAHGAHRLPCTACGGGCSSSAFISGPALRRCICDHHWVIDCSRQRDALVAAEVVKRLVKPPGGVCTEFSTSSISCLTFLASLQTL